MDEQKLGITDYYEVISDPMDISTVYNKLINKEYKYLEDYLNQIQLIWENCKVYNNDPKSAIFINFSGFFQYVRNWKNNFKNR